MSEKLTKEEFLRWFNSPRIGSLSIIDHIWGRLIPRIESDREAVREEMRAEVLKDHFKIGEKIEYLSPVYGTWFSGTIGIGETPDIKDVRRPAKKRPMTHEELVAAMRGTGTYQHLDALKDDTLRDLLAHINISSEVEE